MKEENNKSAIHAIKTAEASLKLARQLIGDSKSTDFVKKDITNLKYIDGTFDGSSMVDASGKKYKINENYATKSMLVYGDKLRAYDENGKYWFKQVDKIKREKVSGMLTKKANVWHVVSSDGSYKVSPEAVKFLNLGINSEVDIFLPSDNKRVPFATLDFVEKTKKIVKKQEKEEKEEDKEDNKEKNEKFKKEAPKKVAPKKLEEKKPVKKSVSKEVKPVEKKEDVKEKVVLEEGDLR